MAIKDDIKEVKEETKSLEKQVKEHSLVWEIIHDLKVENKVIKALLGLSIISNIFIVLLMRG